MHTLTYNIYRKLQTIFGITIFLFKNFEMQSAFKYIIKLINQNWLEIGLLYFKYLLVLFKIILFPPFYKLILFNKH